MIYPIGRQITGAAFAVDQMRFDTRKPYAGYYCPLSTRRIIINEKKRENKKIISLLNYYYNIRKHLQRRGGGGGPGSWEIIVQ